MKSTILAIVAGFILSVHINACAQSADIQNKIKQVENNLIATRTTEGETPATLKERMAHYNIQGLSIAVIHDYKMEWAKGYGWADAGLKIPVIKATVFQAGSISKSLNSMGVLKLLQSKTIDLYTDINTYLLSWKFPYDTLSKGKKITIANLLSHSAGLTVHGFGGYEKGHDIPTIRQVLDGKKPANSDAVRSMYEPGLKYEYSGGGTTISQLIVMDITGQSYTQYMHNNVLKPLGMTSSTYEQPPVNIKPGLISTAYYPDGKEVSGKYHIYPEQAAAGLWTNPTDLSKYIIETQLAYQGRSHKVLDQKTTRLRLTPYIDKSAALGVFIDDFNGEKYFEHGGVDEGFISQYYGSLEGGNGVVVMVNTSNGNAIIPEIVNSVAKVYGFKGLNRSKVFKLASVTNEALDTYTGEYQVMPKFFITISREGNNLFGVPTGERKLQLFPESQNKFYLKDVDVEIEFVRNYKGETTKMILYQNGVHEAKKVK
ncbi:MAG: serine hydrolase [Bacteroidota bacterium]|nr:serine hydrolase [Bacteroidota bacterium]